VVYPSKQAGRPSSGTVYPSTPPAPAVPAPALPQWPQSTNPTAPGVNAARPAPPPPISPAARREAPAGAAPATSPEYGQWARDQRPGTTYGGATPLGAGQTTTAFPAGSPLENSGSLTGHILASGRADGPTPKSNTAKVLLIGLVMLAVLVLAGLLAATLAGDVVSDVFGGLIGG
jgi:hypothetical protein